MNDTRDTRGRFNPGTSGNRSGRPPGITDKRVAVKKQLLAEMFERIGEVESAMNQAFTVLAFQGGLGW